MVHSQMPIDERDWTNAPVGLWMRLVGIDLLQESSKGKQASWVKDSQTHIADTSSSKHEKKQ